MKGKNMKNAKWWMKVWAAVAMAAGLAVPAAHGQAYGLTEVVNGVTWTYSVEADFTATILGASPAEGNLTIPSSFSWAIIP